MVVTNGYFKYENGKLKIVPGPIPFVAGPDGPQGPDGDVGPQGPDGDTGPTGDAGTGSSIVTNGLLMNLDAATYSGSGTTWTDSTGNGNDATFVNAPTKNSNGWLEINQSDSWNATDAAQYNKNGLVYGTGSRTFSTWVNFSDFPYPWNAPLWYADSPDGIVVQQNVGGRWIAGHCVDDVNVVTTSGPSVGVWYFATYTYDSSTGTLKFFINDTLADSKTGLYFETTDNGSPPAYLGRGFVGSMGQVLSYNRALSDAELLQNYEATKARYGL
jgi:hypothetical protein